MKTLTLTKYIFILSVATISTISCAKSKTNGTVYINGIQGPVYINFDQYGIPHILALASDNDSLVALGYVHANDRFWQMEYQRRVGAGRLSEIFGKDTVKEDKFLRTWGFYRASVSLWPNLSPQTQKMISAYTAGVNAYISQNDFPMQVKLLRYTPESWNNYDSIVWQKMLAFNLQNSWISKLDNLYIAESYGINSINKFIPPYPKNGPTILNSNEIDDKSNISYKPFVPQKPQPVHMNNVTTLDNNDMRDILHNLGFEPFEEKGSNSFVVNGTMTKSKKPLLANDTHLNFSSPIFWYLADINGPNLHVIGATIPWLPGVIIGHNENIAWGITAAYNDAQDLFIIPNSESTETIIEQIKIKESDPINYKVEITEHGPIISNDNKAIESIGFGKKFALQWPALESNDTSIQSVLLLNYASNWSQFLAAFHNFVSPSQNFIYADTKGNIGYLLPGKLPIRQDFTGEFPVSNNKKWSGFIPFDELPHSFNTPKGYYVTANNKIVPDTYKYILANRWDVPPYRAKRIIDLITSSQNLDINKFEEFQQDNISYLWKDLSSILLNTAPSDQNSKNALLILSKWDGNTRTDSIGATIFAYWLQQFKTLVPYQSPFGDKSLPSYQYLISTLSKPKQSIFLSSSLDKAINKLIKERGQNQKNWQWGDVHRAYFSELALGQSKLTGWIWERNISSPGGYDTVNVGAYNSKTFNQYFGANYRQVIDLANMESSVYVIPMGQSEEVLSKNYADLLDFWAKGEYITIKRIKSPCDPDQANCLLLLPKLNP